MRSTSIGFLVFPGMMQLDFTGPYAVLAAGPSVETHLIWKNTDPIRSSDGLLFTPDADLERCPPVDVICVPGGGGVLPLLEDGAVLGFLRARAASCRYVTAVCTGALVLGAAGLLRGYSAVTHWQSMDFLAPFGASPGKGRAVVDRDRITAAGVSAGIDMALFLAGLLWGDETAQAIQLNMEYAPQPPYAAGSPQTAPEAVLAAVKARTCARQEERRRVVLRAAAALEKEFA